MVVYSLSPGAYQGLLEVAQHPHFCRDYDRIHRYLEVVVAAREAVLVPGDPSAAPDSCMGWKLFAFLEATEQLDIHRKRF